MLGVVVVALLSVLVPLSLCAVPAFARYTVFPLLSKLIYKFTASYLLPGVQVEYSVGSFTSRARESLRGFSLSIKHVHLRPSFLQSLAFPSKGIAPMTLTACRVYEVTVHLASSWRILVDIQQIAVDGQLLAASDPIATVEMKDVIAHKVHEATVVINRLVQEKQKREQASAMTNQSAQRQFSFKDRVIQLIAAQLDVDVHNVKLNVTSATTANDQQDQNEALVMLTKHDVQATRLEIQLESLVLSTSIEHENRAEALELIFKSPDIRVEHKIRLSKLKISAAEQNEGDYQSLVELPMLEVRVEMPPIVRLLCIVENLAPIPYEQKQCRVQCVSSAAHRITTHTELLVGIMRDFYVPYANFGVLWKSLRLQEVEQAAAYEMADDDRAFYISHYGKIDQNRHLTEQEKKARSKKLQELDAELSLDQIIRLRTAALGLGQVSEQSESELSHQQALDLIQEWNCRQENVMFQQMDVALRMESLALSLEEVENQVGEIVVKQFGVNFSSQVLAADADEDLVVKNLDLMIEQVEMAATYDPSCGSTPSPSTKMVFGDFSEVPKDDELTTPQLIALHYGQHHSGRQDIRAALAHLHLVVSAEALETLALYLDRIGTGVGRAMASARPMVEQQVTSQPVATDSEMNQKLAASLAPFSLLGQQALGLEVVVDDCHVVLLPQPTFSSALYTESDLGVDSNGWKLDSRVDIPVNLHLAVDCSPSKEIIELDVKKLAVLAKYLDLAEHEDDAEALIAPTNLSFSYALTQEKDDQSHCHQHLTMTIPDVTFACSDLSLALLASCSQSLSHMQLTSPEHARLKAETLAKQAEMKRQAELDVVLTRIRRLFDDIDADKNGYVDRSELLMLLRRARVGMNLLESELEYFVDFLLKAIDSDGNGSVEFEELANYLRSDIMSSDNMTVGYDGSSELNGFLNLRGGEYTSMEIVNRICGYKITSMTQFEHGLMKPLSKSRVWEMIEKQVRISEHSLNRQSPLVVQKKLVRLLQNYEAARVCWNALIAASLPPHDGETTWQLQALMHCGGIAEFQNATHLFSRAKHKREAIFGVLHENEELETLVFPSAVPAVPKQLHLTTNFQLGVLRLMLTDLELPATLCRSDFVVQNAKCAFELTGKGIDAREPVNWLKLTSSESSDWTLLIAATVVASCCSETAEAMENVIEPWELLVGLSSNEGEHGFAALVEATKRLQVNITPGLLKTYKLLMEVMDGNAQRTSAQKHQEALQTAMAARSRKGGDCQIQNATGCSLQLQFQQQDEPLVLDRDAKLYVAMSDKLTVERITLGDWGQSKTAISLPTFGRINIPIESFETPTATIFVTIDCRLDTPLRRRLVLKSSLLLCNHSSEAYELKYLALGSELRKSVTSRVLKLGPSERMALPLSVLMGITEVYARPQGYDEWLVKATLDDEFITSAAAMKQIEYHEHAQKTKLMQRRTGTAIVYADSEETCSVVLKQLAPNVLVRRWHLRKHIEWELSLLPPFVLRNSLPYMLQYRFMEYKASPSKNPNEELQAIRQTLQADATECESKDIASGLIPSGQDAQVPSVTCLRPGYLAVRLVIAGCDDRTAWSNPLLMDIHGEIDRFTKDKEMLTLEDGLEIDLERLSLPGFPRLVRFSAPYWLINGSAFDLAFVSTVHGARTSSYHTMAVPASQAFHHPILAHLDHGRLSLKPIGILNQRPDAWELLGSIPDRAFTRSSLMDDTLKASEWSEPVNTTAINTVGECVCGPAVFAMKVEGLYGAFEGSIALTLSPRFFVQNRLRETVLMQAFSSSEASLEKVTDHFRKQNQSLVQVRQFTVHDNETMPLHNFASLKSNEPLQKSPKYISVSLETKWDNGVQWSFAIPITNAGDLYFQLYSPMKKRFIVCQASVQVVEMYVYIILSDVSIAPPYRIENYTPFAVECCQLGETSMLFARAQKESKEIVSSGRWHAFAWHNPVSRDRRIELRVRHNDGATSARAFDIDQVGYHGTIAVEESHGEERVRTEILVQVVVDENTRVLQFLEKQSDATRSETQELQLEEEFQQRKTSYASSFDIRLAGLGLSLFDALPQEVLFASIDVIQLQKRPSSLEWTFSILHCQVDNMLTTAKFPVLLNPMGAGYSSDLSSERAPPVFKLVLDADLAARIGVYRLLDVSLSHLALKLDIDYLVNLVKLLEPYMASDTMVHAASLRMLDTVLNRRVPPVPVMQLTASGNIRRDLVYFDTLRIHSVTVDLEYSITRKDIAGDTSGGGGGRSILLGWITQIIGLIGSNLSGSPTLHFNEIVILRCFSTKQRLQSQLVQNFIRQAVLQAYKLIGSVDIIGNPIGLVEDLGSGVIEFLKITKDEVLGDSQTRGEGVKVLGKTIVKTGASTLAKVTGSLDRFVGEFTDAEQTQQTQEKKEAQASHVPETGIAPIDGGLKFAKEFGKGLTGIFTKPVEGAMKGGVTGLVQGTVQGIAGPGVVILKQLTSTSHNIALGVQSTVIDRSPFGGRRRPPKQVQDKTIVAEFDATHYRPTRMTLELMGASGLISGSSCDPRGVVRLDDREILKTKVLYNTANPMWREKTQVELNGTERSLAIEIKDCYGGGTIERPIGKCVLSLQQLQDQEFKAPEYGSDLARWVHTGVKPDNTKTNLSRQIKDKEFTLVAPSEEEGPALVRSSRKLIKQFSKSESLSDVQVIITIVGVRNLHTKGMGGGVLGLGNLVSSTPKIAPYVSLTIGTQTNRTTVSKMEWTSDHFGKVQWPNETFTFRLPTDQDPRVVSFALMDKSMLQDETLGYAYKPIDLSLAGEAEEEAMVEALELYDRPATDHGTVVGYLMVKIHVTGASTKSEKEATNSKAAEPEPPAAVKVGKVRIACEFT